MKKFEMILLRQEDQTRRLRPRMPFGAGPPSPVWRGGRIGRLKDALIADVYTFRNEFGSQETHAEDQGRRRVGPPGTGRRHAGRHIRNRGG